MRPPNGEPPWSPLRPPALPETLALLPGDPKREESERSPQHRVPHPTTASRPHAARMIPAKRGTTSPKQTACQMPALSSEAVSLPAQGELFLEGSMHHDFRSRFC